MHLPQLKQESSPLRKFAQASLEKPGMYLIALRAHLGRGKSIIGEVIHSVADSLPVSDKSNRARASAR
jgi:hypothetical protein